MFVKVLPRKQVMEQRREDVSCKKFPNHHASVLVGVPPCQIDTDLFPELGTTVRNVIAELKHTPKNNDEQ
jgi:hypothetical protein